MISPTMAKIINHLPKKLVYYISKILVNIYVKKYANIEVIGKENIALAQSPIIFIGNHLSNSDGLVLSKILKDMDVTFVAGVKLSNNPLTNIGVNVVKTITIKPNSADKEALNSIIKNVKAGNNVFIFPEGTRSRTGSMIEAKKGILLIARLTGAAIVPVGIWGTEKLMPVNLAGDMGAEKFQYADVKVRFGKPVTISAREKDEDRHQYDKRALTELMKSISVLLPEEYRGVYK